MFSIIPVFLALVITLLAGIAFKRNETSALVSALVMTPILFYFQFTETFDVVLSYLIIFLFTFVFTEFTDSIRQKLKSLIGIQKPVSRKKKQ